MFDFGSANADQRKAIETADGPVLIIAGPGTGKTYTLVQRAVYLIQECGAAPEQILMATFTDKAARELVTRITNELANRGIVANLNEMYIGTFHSLCLRIIKENLEYTRLKKNYRTLDAFDQSYTVFQNIYRFRAIEGIGLIAGNGGAWRQANEICGIVNKLSEELVDPGKLKTDGDPQIAAAGQILEIYGQMLSEYNLLDFAAIQTEAYRLLTGNPAILSAIQEKIKYIMIDEYQDTNYIQEQIVFTLGGAHKNICVVGDDDQGLYRFRGATIRNILEFPGKFAAGECRIIKLVVNYRSNSDIVDFYNNWMSATGGASFSFQWDEFRYEKAIVPNGASRLDSPAVVKLSAVNDIDEWHGKILLFINRLKESGRLANNNQLAFLFNSVRHERVLNFANFLENNGVNVYSPRSDMFFDRDEIRLTIGCLMLLFPGYVEALENREYDFLSEEHYVYYKECVIYATEIVKAPENIKLLIWLRTHGRIHANLKGNTDYAYSGLIYRMFEHEPFKNIIGIDLNAGVVDVRPVRNIALFTQIIGKYEYLHNISVLNGSEYRGKRRIDDSTEKLFNMYLRLLYDEGISEYEDDAEYAPSGCVSFLTIHQSKGMEFPIVFVDSLSNVPRRQGPEFMRKIEDSYYHRKAFEPSARIKYYDFWRLYYTAFSRAQDLLILTCNETGGRQACPSKYFIDIYDEVADAGELDISEFEFKTVKDVNLKDSFSFTSHISVYETCSVQYKFYKELEFMPVRVNAIVFGMLVHQTIEDIHRAALRDAAYLITPGNVENWFEANYASISKSERTYLAGPQKDAALKHVLRYVEKQTGKWGAIRQAEVNVSLVKPEYIIEGKIDLIKGAGDTVELVDFKAEKKPDLIKDAERIERYRRQLQLYAHLVEERTGQKVSRMNLYYTGEEGGNPVIPFPYSRTAIDATVKAFDDTVHKIMNKEFANKAANTRICEGCDFRYHCG